VDHFTYRDGTLHGEDVELETLAATVGTPAYLYSRRTLEGHLQSVRQAFAELEPLVCFAVKALSNVHTLRLLADGGAGADVVSGGELHRALLAGVPAGRIVFAGVGKSAEELRTAVEVGIRCVNVESEGEIEVISQVAHELDRTVRVALRVNPDVPGYRTPQNTTTGTRGGKFGIDLERVATAYARAAQLPGISLEGLHFHLGSPIYDPRPYDEALEKILRLVRDLRLAGLQVGTINVGGGFAADYESDTAPGWDRFAEMIVPRLRTFAAEGGQVILEPGRSIAANAGVLLTRVRYLKTAGDRVVAIVDAGMSHLIRAALYDTFHFIWPVTPRGGLVPPLRTRRPDLPNLAPYDLAGPICESSDYLAKSRELPPLQVGDLLCVFTTGAYGMTMASHYNSAPRPPEVLLDGSTARLIRRRETYADLVEPELTTQTLDTPSVLAQASARQRAGANATVVDMDRSRRATHAGPIRRTTQDLFD
jgi:diaminopimelate decarboxylase